MTVTERMTPQQRKPPCCFTCFAAAFLAAVIGTVFAPCLSEAIAVSGCAGDRIVTSPLLLPTWENIVFFLTRPWEGFYSPTAMLSLIFDRACFGTDSFWYHLHNIAGHVTGAFFLYLALSRLGMRRNAALFLALLWALLPARAASVASIAGRRDIACHLFAFVSVWAFLRTHRSRLRAAWYALSALAGLISLGAQASAWMLMPAVACAALVQAGEQRKWTTVFTRCCGLWLWYGAVTVFVALMAAAGGEAGIAESRCCGLLEAMLLASSGLLFQCRWRSAFAGSRLRRVIYVAAALVIALAVWQTRRALKSLPAGSADAGYAAASSGCTVKRACRGGGE